LVSVIEYKDATYPKLSKFSNLGIIALYFYFSALPFLYEIKNLAERRIKDSHDKAGAITHNNK
jgi:hypothetical protein